jgi:hypothetical protein
MPSINIDALCEPITVTVGGKTYTVDDISRETAARMEKIGNATKETTDLAPLAGIMAEVLNADKADIAKLGMRKLLMLVTKVMGAINEEIEGKNSPKAAVMK